MKRLRAWMRGIIAEATSSGNYNKGAEAYNSEDYATALAEFVPLAEAGYDEAQYLLGVMYANALGIPKDEAEAVKWYHLAAEAGNVRAQFSLGEMYDEGKGVAQDYAEAMKWYHLAAKAKHPRAQNNLGEMYLKGRGVPQDTAEAVKWFHLAISRESFSKAYFNLEVICGYGESASQDSMKAAVQKAVNAYKSEDYATARVEVTPLAEAGNARAQLVLGIMYNEGRGGKQDYRFAYLWFSLASEQGCGIASKGCIEVLASMTSSQLTEALDMVKRYHAAETRDVEAQKGADAYSSGDYATAFTIFTALAEAGHTEAEYKLGLMYYYGEGVAQDYEEAAEWISRAASAEFADAQNTLGEMYYEGKGVYVNYDEAVICFGDAANAGHPEAQWNLGHMYLNGEGIEQDNHRAYIWFGRAAIQGCEMAKKSCSLMDLYMTYSEIAEAQNDLGLMYEDGREVEQDYIIAYRWFSLAAAEGHEEASEKCNSYKEFMAPGIMSAEKEAAKKMLETL